MTTVQRFNIQQFNTLYKTFHQRTLSRTGHARNAAHHAQGQIGGQVLDIVQTDILQMEKGIGLAHLLLYRACRIERSTCKRLTVKQFVVTAFKDDFAPSHTRAWTHINNVVGYFYHFLVMLHEDDRVAVVFQFLYRLLHQ